MPHLKGKDEEEEEFGVKVPKISMDYFYMRKNDEKAKQNPLLVILNEETNENTPVRVAKRASGQRA